MSYIHQLRKLYLKIGAFSLVRTLLAAPLPANIAWIEMAAAMQTNSCTFPETGKTVRGRFLYYWNTRAL